MTRLTVPMGQGYNSPIPSLPITTADGQFPEEAIWVLVQQSAPPPKHTHRLMEQGESEIISGLEGPVWVFTLPGILNFKHVCLFTLPARASLATR